MNSIIFTIFEILGYTLLASSIYIYLLNRLAKFAQPARLRLAVEGRNLLADPTLSPRERQQVIFYLTNTYSVWPVFVSVLFFPFIVAALLFPVFRAYIKRESNSKLCKIKWQFTWSTVAASPFFGFILMAEYALIIALFIITFSQIEFARSVMTTLAQVENQIGAQFLPIK